jgi:hypothetical protein
MCSRSRRNPRTNPVSAPFGEPMEMPGAPAAYMGGASHPPWWDEATFLPRFVRRGQ